jgi:hypothetical protein
LIEDPQMTQDKDNIISSDNLLTDQQRSTLSALVNMIIPASEDGRMPGADELDLLAYVRDESGALNPGIQQGLNALDQAAMDEFGLDFASLTDTDKQRQVDAIRVNEPEFVQRLLLQTVSAYYQNDRVIIALGLEPRPPFPEGHTVEAGDLSLLDPVRKRSKLYREV